MLVHNPPFLVNQKLMKGMTPNKFLKIFTLIILIFQLPSFFIDIIKVKLKIKSRFLSWATSKTVNLKV